jgi:phosphoenolpyruvate carboxylase
LIENNASQINQYLQQLGKTPFFKKQKPTPYDEAVSLIWYLENIFYNAAGRIISFLKDQFPHAMHQDKNPVITMGFWPGGDRDGNPNVTTETTLKVAETLHSTIIKCYYLDVRRLKRRLTFKGVDSILIELEERLYHNLFFPGQDTDITKAEILEKLYAIREVLIYQHNSMFLPLLDRLINKVYVFGLHFASLDIRQDSTVHHSVLEAIAEQEDILPKDYANLSPEKRIEILTNFRNGRPTGRGTRRRRRAAPRSAAAGCTWRCGPTATGRRS